MKVMTRRERLMSTYGDFTISSGTNDFATTIVSREYIEDTLAIYKPEYLYLYLAEYHEKPLERASHEIIGHFYLSGYTFTKEGYCYYLTASMLMLFLSQLGYVYARLLCEKEILPISANEFARLRDEGNIVISSLERVKFRSRIALEEKTVSVKMRLLHWRMFHSVNSSRPRPEGITVYTDEKREKNSSVCCALMFDVGHGRAEGKGQMVFVRR